MTRLPTHRDVAALVSLLSVLATFSRADDGSLTPEMLRTCTPTSRWTATRALHNALTGNDARSWP